MRKFRSEICAPCQGKLYSRQCRMSRAWRGHKVATFDDLDCEDFSCPYGLEIKVVPEAHVGLSGVIAPRVGCKDCRGGAALKQKGTNDARR